MSKNAPGLFPAAFTPSLFRDGEWMNEVKLFTRLFGPLNRIRASTAALQQVWKAHQSATVSIPTSAWTMVPMGAVDIDTIGAGITSGGFAVPATGVYLVSGCATFPAVAGGTRRLASINLNSTFDPPSGSITFSAPSSSFQCLPIPGQLAVATQGQVLQLWQWQDTGAAITAGITTGLRGSISVWRVA